MLDLIRKKTQSLAIQIIVGLIILVFVFWGVGGGGTGRNSIARVNDEEITIKVYQQAYDRTVNAYRKQFGSSMSAKLLEQLGIKRQVVRQLVQQALLRQGAREMGLDTTDREVQDTIQKMASFKEKGIFSMKRYQEILSGSRISPSDFEASVRADLLSGKGWELRRDEHEVALFERPELRRKTTRRTAAKSRRKTTSVPRQIGRAHV